MQIRFRKILKDIKRKRLLHVKGFYRSDPFKNRSKYVGKYAGFMREKTGIFRVHFIVMMNILSGE